MVRPDSLERRLGFWSAVGLVVGVVIGSGIFRTPGAVAARVPDPDLVLLIWLLGGLISLCGALSVAELAAAFPQTGGWYVFLREGWGRLAGFLFGWAELLLIRASATGAIATVFSEYALRSLGVEAGAGMADGVAAGAIAVAAAVNIAGIRLGAALAAMSSLAKFGALASLIIASAWLGGGAGGTTANFVAGGQAVQAGLFGLALISVLWAYDGFADVAFAAGEIREPHRNLPRAIVAGTTAIVAIYIAANAAYLYVSPVTTVAQSPLIAATTMEALFGAAGSAGVSVTVAVSTFGALVATMLVAPRIFFAMAADRLFFAAMARIHPRTGTPYVAILLCAALGVAFVLTRTFDQLADTFVLTIWPFYGVAVLALYRLRRRRPDLPRPYRVPGYPIVPGIFIAAVVYLVANALIADPVWTGLTFAVVAAGVPVYFLAFRPART